MNIKDIRTVGKTSRSIQELIKSDLTVEILNMIANNEVNFEKNTLRGDMTYSTFDVDGAYVDVLMNRDTELIRIEYEETDAEIVLFKIDYGTGEVISTVLDPYQSSWELDVWTHVADRVNLFCSEYKSPGKHYNNEFDLYLFELNLDTFETYDTLIKEAQN